MLGQLLIELNLTTAADDERDRKRGEYLRLLKKPLASAGPRASKPCYFSAQLGAVVHWCPPGGWRCTCGKSRGEPIVPWPMRADRVEVR